MNNWIDIPEIQLLAVIFTGFFIGWLLVPKLISNPVLFGFITGMIFFGVRFVPAFAQIDKTSPGSIPGNGIISAAIMFVVYYAFMGVGYWTVSRLWPEVKS